MYVTPAEGENDFYNFYNFLCKWLRKNNIYWKFFYISYSNIYIYIYIYVCSGRLTLECSPHWKFLFLFYPNFYNFSISPQLKIKSYYTNPLRKILSNFFFYFFCLSPLKIKNSHKTSLKIYILDFLLWWYLVFLFF